MKSFKIYSLFIVSCCFFIQGIQSVYAQKLLDPSGTISVVGASSGGSNTTVAVAYSVRQLKTTYDHAAITPPAAVTGFTNSTTPLIRVKRSFDNAQLDIGYDGNGNIDTIVLKNFVTGKIGVSAATHPTASGQVVIWYDQSGNSRDASVGSSALCVNQAIAPFIVSGGIIERNGGGQIGIAGKNGGMLGDGGTTFDLAESGYNRYGITADRTLNVVCQPRAWSTVGGPHDGSGTYLIDRNGGMGLGIQDPPLTCVKAVGNYWAAQIRNEANDISKSFSGTIPISINRSDNVTIIRSGNTYPLYVNGVLAGSNILTGNNAQSPVRIGYGCPYGEDVYYGEFVLFPSALSTTNLTALNTSQNNYFSLGSAPGTWTGATSSDVTIASNWSNNAVPDALSIVTIPSGTPNAPIITGGQQNILFKKLIVSPGATLTINGNASVSSDVIVNGTINGTGTLTMNGALAQTIGGTPVITVSNLVVANTADTILLLSDMNISGTLTVNTGAVLNIGATRVINSAAAAGTITGTGTVMATRVTATADFQSQYKFSNYNLSALTVNYGGAGAQTVNLGVNYGNLVVSGSGIKVLSAAITATNVTGNITVNSGTLYTNNFNIGSPANRTITVALGATFSAGTSVITFGSGTKQFTLNGIFQTENLNGFSLGASTAISSTNTPTITPSATSTVEYNASSAQTVTATSYGGVILTGGSKTISSGTLTLAGDLLINTGATYNGAANPALNIAGSFTNNGTYTPGTGLVTFNGTGAQSITSTTSPLAFGGSVTFSGASSAATMGVNATLVGTLTVNTSKTLDLQTYSFNRTAASGTLVVAGTLKLGGNSGGQSGSNFPTNFSTLTFTGGTIEYNGSNAISQAVYPTTSYHNLVLTNGSGTGNAAKTLAGNLTVASGRVMTVNAGATLTPSVGNVLTGTSAEITGNGTIVVTGGVGLGTQYAFTTRTLTNLTVNYNGGGTIAAGTYSTLTTSGSGTTLLGGAVIITGNVTIGANTVLNTNNNTLSVAGNWTDNGGTFIAGNSTVTFNGTNQVIGGSDSSSFNNITLSNNGNIVVTANNTQIAGTLTVGSTTTLIPDAGVVFNSAAALGTITGTGTINVTRITATADYQNQYKFNTNTLNGLTTNYAGSGNQTINFTGSVNYGNLSVSGSGVKTLGAAMSATNATGNITVNAATFSTGNFAIVSPANRTITVAQGAILNAGTSTITFGSGTKQLTLNGTFQTQNLNGFSSGASTSITSTNSPTITPSSTSVVEYNAASTQIVTATSYGGLVLSGGSKTISSGTVTLSGNLLINTSATYNGAANPVLNVAGNFTNNGTFTSGTGLVTFNGTAAQAVTSSTSPLVFGGSVTFSGASSTATMGVNATLAGTLTVSTAKTLDLQAYTFNRSSPSGTLVVAGILKLGGNTGGQAGSNFPTNFSTYTFTGGIVEYNGSDAITQTVYSGVSYAGLTLTNGSGLGTALKISTGNFTVTGTMTVNLMVLFTPTSGNIITGSGATLTGYGSIDVVGAALATQYAFTNSVLTNITVNYVGGGGTIAAGTYSSLTTSGSGITSLGGAVIVTGSVTIGAGTTLDVGSHSLEVAGDWENNGTYTTGAALVTLNGTGGQTIRGTSVTSFSSLTIANTNAAVNVSTSLNVSGTLTVNASTLLVPDEAVVFNNAAAAGTLTGSGTIKVTRILSTASLMGQYKFNTYTVTNMAVDYAGAGAQTINSTVALGTNYGALTQSGSGTKTLQGNITVNNDISLLSGTFATAGFNITTSGSWLNNGVTFGGSGTVNLNGSGKTVSGTTLTEFPLLVVGAGASYTMNNNNSCTGLTFTASGSASSFTHGTNNILTVNGNVTINQPTVNSVITSWNINASAVTVTGTFNLGGSSNSTGRVSSVVITTGALTVNGAATITGSTTATNTLINMSGGSGILSFGGTVTLSSSSTLNAGTTSTVNYNGTVAQTIPISTTFVYNNLNTANLHAGGASLSAAVTASNLLGNLSVTTGILNTSNNAVAMANTRVITVSNGGVLNAGTTSVKPGTGATVTIDGSFITANTVGFSGAALAAISSDNAPAIVLGDNSTISYNALTGGQAVTAGTYANLTLGNTSGNQTAGGNVVVNGTLTTEAGGTFVLGNNTLSGTLGSISHSGIITTTNSSGAPLPTGKTWGGTVNYARSTGGQTIVAGTYATLTLSNTSGTQTAAGDIVTTTLNHNVAGITLNMVTYSLTAATITNNATATIRTQNISAAPISAGLTIDGNISYDAATGGQTIVGGTYSTLTMGNTSGTQTASGNITATILSNNTSGIMLDMTTYALSGITTYTVNAGATLRTQNTSGAPIPTGKTWGGTVLYDAPTGGQTIMAGTYNNLTISNTSGTDTASGAIVSNGTFTNTAGGLLDMRTYALTVATVANNGTLTTLNTSSTPITSGKTWGGEIIYAGSGAQTIVAGNYNNLTSSSSGARTLINGGTIAVAGTFTHGINTYTITGNTFEYNGTEAQTVASFDYNNLTISGARGNQVISLEEGTIAIAGTFSITATSVSSYDVSGNTVNYNGSAGQTVLTVFEYNNLTFSNAGAKTGAATINAVFSLEGTATAGSVLVYGPGATLQYNKPANYSASTNEWPATFAGEGGVVIMNTGVISIAGNAKVISFGLNIHTTTKLNLGTTTTHTANGLILGGVSRSQTGTWGSTSSTATNKNDSFFSATTGRITLSSPVSVWDGSGGTTWSTASNWTPATVPTSSRDAVIPTGITNMPNITGAASCRSLTIGSGMTVTTNNNTVNINGDYINNGGTFAAGSSAINISGATNQVLDGFTTTGAVTISNATGDVILNGTTNAGSITLSVSGVNVIINGTTTVTGAVTINSSATANFGAGISGSGILNAASLTVGSNITPSQDRTTTLTSAIASLQISGDLTLRADYSNPRRNSPVLIHTSGIISVGGSLTTQNNNANTATYTMGNSSPELKLSGATPFTLGATTNNITLSGTGAIVNYNSTSAQTARATTYYTLKVNNKNSTGVTLGGATTTKNLVIGDDTSSSVFRDGGYTLTLSQTPQLDLVSGTYYLGAATATSWPNFTTANISTGTTVAYVATNAQTISTAPDYSNLTLTGATTKTIASGTLTVTGELSTTSTLTTLATNNSSAAVSGDITGSGPITSGSGTISIAGDWTNNGTFTAGSGTVDYNGSGAQTIAALTYNNLTISNSRTGSPAVTLPSGTVKVGGAFTVSATGVGSYPVTGNTIEYSGAGAQTIAPFNYNNLTLSGARGNATITLGSGNISIAGAFSNTATSVGGYTKTGNVFTYTSLTGGQSITPFVYNDLVLDNSSGTNSASGNIVVDGALTTAAGGTLQLGTYTLSGSLTTITHNGTITTNNTSILPIAAGKTWGGTIIYGMTTGSQTIVAGTYNILTQEHTSVYNSLSGNITVNNALNFAASGTGKLVLGSNTITLAGTVGNMTAGRCFTANGSSGIIVNGTGALGSDLYLDQSSRGVTNRISTLTYNRASATITIGDTIEVTGTITPTAGTLATSNKLKLISNASGTARVAAGTGSYITGNVTVERYIPAAARRWRFMGATVSGTTFADLKNEIFLTGSTGDAGGFDVTLSNQASIYGYDESVITGDANSGYIAATNIADSITVGKGYRIFIRGDRSDPGRLDGTVSSQNAVTINLIGPLNKGSIPLPVTYTPSGTPANDGWNLVANPYASAIDWNALHDAGRSGSDSNFSGTDYARLKPTVYIYNATTNSYTSYNALSNSGVGQMSGGIIPAGAAFWVQAVAASPSLTMKEVYKTTGSPAAVFKNNNDQFTIRLIKDSISSDEMAVKFIPETKAGADAYDIPKLYAGDVDIASIGTDGSFLSVNCKPFNGHTDTIPMSLGFANSGEYKMEFAGYENLGLGVNHTIYLIDQFKKSFRDLRTTTTYEFTVDKNDAATFGNKRFMVVIGEDVTAVPEFAGDALSTYLYPAVTNGLTTVYYSRDITENVEVTVTDLSGKTVMTLTESPRANRQVPVDLSMLQSGLYFISMVSNGHTVQTLRCVKQ